VKSIVQQKKQVVVGIDEAGRGPLAGPMVIAAVFGMPVSKLSGIKDSKKLTPRAREVWYKTIIKHAKYKYVSVSHQAIDTMGLSAATKKAMVQLLENINPGKSEILLDGGLKAPTMYIQQTIIKGDERVPIIAAASIIAKVTRDRMMVRLAKKYPLYGFALHKGYGTRVHCAAIKKYGLSPYHRKSFCKNIIS